MIRTEAEVREALEKWQAHAKKTGPPDAHSEGYYLGIVHAFEFVLGRSKESIREEIGRK